MLSSAQEPTPLHSVCGGHDPDCGIPLALHTEPAGPHADGASECGRGAGPILSLRRNRCCQKEPHSDRRAESGAHTSAQHIPLLYLMLASPTEPLWKPDLASAALDRPLTWTVNSLSMQEGGGSSKQRREHMMVPASDAAALAAYVRTLAAVACQGSAAVRAQRLAAWESAAQVSGLARLCCCTHAPCMSVWLAWMTCKVTAAVI